MKLRYFRARAYRVPATTGPARWRLDRPVANVPPRLFPDERAGIGDATRQGQEVLALIAEGRTDRQIAGPLFISPRTVAMNVSSIPARIGVTSRGGAAAVAHRLRLGG